LTSRTQRIQRIQQLLNQLGVIQSIRLSGRTEKLFELECYLRTAARLAQRNKIPRAMNTSGRVFRVLYNPGNIANASHLAFVDRSEPSAEKMELFMNCEVRGKSSVEHSPDILLTIGSTRLSIYECKEYSTPLDISVYREFIGFLVELGLVRANGRNSRLVDRVLPELSPRIYTTASVLPHHAPLARTYGFSLEGMLP